MVICLFQFTNVGTDSISKMEFDFVDAPNAKVVHDSTDFNLSLQPGESKEYVLVLSVSCNTFN